MIEVSTILLIIGFVITLASGSAVGAYINRRFQLKDIKKLQEQAKTPEKITLEKTEDLQKFEPVGDGKHFIKKAYKRFKLTNSSSRDIEGCKLIFEFDKFSTIAEYQIHTPKGSYQCRLIEKENVRYEFEIKEFNRKNEIEFQFEQEIEDLNQDMGFENFWDVFLTGCTGVELEKITTEQTKLLSGAV